MKKISLLLATITLSTLSYSQETFNKWSVGYEVGGHIWAKPNSEGADLQNFQVSHHAINGRYMFNNRLGIMVDFGYDFMDFFKLGGQNTHFVRGSIQSVVNLGDIIKLNTLCNRFGLLLHTGLGYGGMWQKYPVKTSVDDVLMASFGLTPQLRLTDHWALRADFTAHLNWSQQNYFDFTSRLPGARSFDYTAGFGNISLGVTYYIGKNKSHADWTPTVYGDKYDDTELRKKIEDAEKKLAEVEEKVKDDDNDGVPNYHDKEPNTPEGVKVDSDGMELKDSDGDGVRDDIDACPDKAGIKENLGCPEIPKEHQELMQQAIEGVKFQTGKDILTNESHNVLDFVALNMKNNPQYKLKIEGHTDNVDDDAYNMDLSNRRAEAVKQYLQGRGVAADRMQTKGFGETTPIATNDTEEGRARNRRVDFIIVFKFD